MIELKEEAGQPGENTGVRKRKKRISASEKTSLLWKRRIMKEKGISEKLAASQVEKLEKLIDYMQYGHALIAYYKQNEIFCLSNATLAGYEHHFHLHYDRNRVKSTVVFWDNEQEGWRTFQIENFLEWRPFF